MNKIILLLLSFVILLGQPVLAAPTRFTSPNFGVESIIFGGTGVLRTASTAVPPVITSGPYISDVTTTGVQVNWTTDKQTNSLVLVGTESGTYSLQVGVTNAVIYTAHAVKLSQLTKATKYFYKVRSSDISGNSVESAENTFSTDTGDITPPKLTAGPFFSNSSSTAMTVSWGTDEAATTTVEYGIAAVSERGNTKPDDFTTFHQIEITGLIPDQIYKIRVKSKDKADNLMASGIFEIKTQKATTITDVKVSDVTLNSAIVQWKTTTLTTSKIKYGLSQAKDQLVTDDAFAQSHVIRLSGLQSGSIYYFQISGSDQTGGTISSDEYVFRTVVLPVISDFQVSQISSSGATLTWISSSDVDELVRYEVLSSSDPKLIGKKKSAGNDKVSSIHTMVLSDLESGAKYSTAVSGKDIFGNQAISPTITFDTKVDSEPPLIKNIKSDTSVDLGSKQSVQVLVSFGLSEPGLSYLEFGEGASGSFTKTITTDTEVSQNKFMVIPGLQPGESYHFRIVAKDRVGNTATSSDYLVLAPSQPVSLLDLIFGQIRLSFGWLTKL